MENLECQSPAAGGGNDRRYLDNIWVCENFVEYLQLLSPGFQGIYNPIFVASADLHQRNQTHVGSSIMMFQVNSYLTGGLQLIQHLQYTPHCINKGSSRSISWYVWNWISFLIYRIRVLEL